MRRPIERGKGERIGPRVGGKEQGVGFGTPCSEQARVPILRMGESANVQLSKSPPLFRFRKKCSHNCGVLEGGAALVLFPLLLISRSESEIHIALSAGFGKVLSQSVKRTGHSNRPISFMYGK